MLWNLFIGVVFVFIVYEGIMMIRVWVRFLILLKFDYVCDIDVIVV